MVEWTFSRSTMHYGNLPDPAPLPVPPTRGTSRRRVLAGAGLFLAGLASGGAALRWAAARPGRAERADPDTPPAAATARDAAPPRRGSLAWVRSLSDASDDELIAAAGDLERARARHRDAADTFEPLFTRILVAIRDRSGAAADMAGACAVRSLARLDRAELAARLSSPLAGRFDLPRTLEQRQLVRERLQRGRSR